MGTKHPNVNGVSRQKLAANRANAQRSTGARTPQGKTQAALNSLKHGGTSDRVLLPGESVEEFNDLAESLWAYLAPEDPVDRLLARRIIEVGWRSKRVGLLQGDFLWRAHHLDREEEEQDAKTEAEFSAARGNRPPRRQPAPETERFGWTFAANLDKMLNFSRYETAYERKFFRLLREYECRRAGRARTAGRSTWSAVLDAVPSSDRPEITSENEEPTVTEIAESATQESSDEAVERPAPQTPSEDRGETPVEKVDDRRRYWPEEPTAEEAPVEKVDGRQRYWPEE